MAALAYLDTSALTKLLVQEPETDALQADVASRPGLAASHLTVLEARRALLRKREQPRISTFEELARTLLLIDISRPILDHAAALTPPELRSLDAIHLATALSIGDLSVQIITYDKRLADAARAHGLTVVQPGR